MQPKNPIKMNLEKLQAIVARFSLTAEQSGTRIKLIDSKGRIAAWVDGDKITPCYIGQKVLLGSFGRIEIEKAMEAAK